MVVTIQTQIIKESMITIISTILIRVIVEKSRNLNLAILEFHGISYFEKLIYCKIKIIDVACVNSVY